MIVTFEEDYLRELYEDGQASDKKHRFQPQIIKKYTHVVDLMMAEANVMGLTKYGGIIMIHVEGKDDRMVANNLEPHYLTHPGEGIKDELEFRGISQRRLAKLIGVPASQLNEVLNAKRPLSAELALLIGQALDIEAAPLLALQMKYNLLSAKRDKSFLERLKEIPRIAAIF